MYPEMELGTVLLPFLMLVVPLHGPRHSVMLMLSLLLFDLHPSNTRKYSHWYTPTLAAIMPVDNRWRDSGL